MRSFILQITGSLFLLIWLLGGQAQFWPSPVLEQLEWASYDQRVEHSLPQAADPSIIIVDIDERSLQQLGQWPWPREYVASLAYELFEQYQVQLLAFDIIFSEGENNLLASQWQTLRQQYPELPETPSVYSGDEMLASLIEQYPIVTSFYFEQSSADLPSSGSLPAPLSVESDVSIDNLNLPKPQRFSGNLDLLQNAAINGGFFDNPMVDQDGVFRRVPLVQDWQGELYPTLSLAILHTLLGQPAINVDAYESGGMSQLESFDLMGFELPVDERGGVLVPWYGERGTFKYISALDVLTGEADASQLQDAIVLIGTSAPGLMDLRVTPVGSVYPGVEIHASLLAGMLAQELKAEPGYSLAVTILGLLVLGLLMTWLYPRLAAVYMLLISAALASGHIALNWWAWQSGWVLPLASGLLLIALMTAWHLTFNFWRESAEKKRVADQFGRYIPRSLVKDIVASPAAQNMDGMKANLSVLFSDIRGFTSFAEGLDPSELTTVMNRLLTPVTAAIHEQRGTIDKYMGDAVMAFWGAPLPESQHAEHAMRGALAMQAALAVINEEFMREGKSGLAMGIGIHTGEMSVGNMGSEFRMAYTVMGDNVNLGSRLEGLTRFYDVDIIISEDSLNSVEQPHDFVTRMLDRVQVKGRDNPVTIYQLMGIKAVLPEADSERAAISDQAIGFYLQGDFERALQTIERLMERFPDDSVAKIYRDRCRDYIDKHPGSDWNGVFEHQTK